ncbi:Cytochrome P450 107B1 [Actinomadura rubteroloni]|uniref:Cytochrome P450 107B1 n=1 Tax=Actinomadura rubteroloni TaxID=1926885 RepID=A0A2P4UP83_9ACTN|nr:cytochrome P450 [Actinomadura rubteroloni]POM26855.1 Cytochrome P450 107B1 [Actinomadura rubteroloni]
MGQAIVDAAAVLGFDPFDPTFRADPYRGYPPPGRLVRTDAGLWVTSSYALCEHALRDPSFGHGLGDEGETWRQGPRQRSFLTMDPPDHTRLRRLVSKAFTPRLVERLRPRVTALVDELLDAAAGARTDLIAALAYPLPVIVISELLGVPAADRDRFKDWSEALARGLDPDFLLPESEIVRREAARAEFNAYFRALAAERRASPRDDLLSALVAVSDGGDALTEEELLATCVLLLVAGHETTVNLIGNGALALLRNPAQLALFRSQPDAAPAAIEELLRYDPPVQFTLRTAVVDTELGGTPLPKGSFVLLLNGMANRDPSVFAEPDRLDLTRYAGGSAARHLSFGQGIHYCLGAPLARLEGQVALSKLFERNVTMAAGPVTYRDNLVLRGLESLHVDLSA